MTYGFHPEADAEHLEAVAWYESRGAGLECRVPPLSAEVIREALRQ